MKPRTVGSDALLANLEPERVELSNILSSKMDRNQRKTGDKMLRIGTRGAEPGHRVKPGQAVGVSWTASTGNQNQTVGKDPENTSSDRLRVYTLRPVTMNRLCVIESSVAALSKCAPGCSRSGRRSAIGSSAPRGSWA